MNTTAAAVNKSTANTNKQQTAKEVIAANVQALIEQLEQGHSEALTAYLTAMGRFHTYSFGNILEIARQKREWPAPQNRSVIANDNPAPAFMGDLMMRLAKTQDLPANQFCHGATRSSMRKRKIRQT